MHRAWIVALMTASTVAVAGCASARKVSTPEPTSASTDGTDEPPKKEYQWKDMSGSGMYRQLQRPNPMN
jgi:hypothetical protein